MGRESVPSLKFFDEKILRRGRNSHILRNESSSYRFRYEELFVYRSGGEIRKMEAAYKTNEVGAYRRVGLSHEVTSGGPFEIFYKLV